MKDIFNNKCPVQIDTMEWWFNGRFIQEHNNHLIFKYITFASGKTSDVSIHKTFKKAVDYCLKNPNKMPLHFPKDFL